MFMFGRFMFLTVVGGISAFEVLFFILAAVKVIPDFRLRHIAEWLLLALMRVFIPGTFHNLYFVGDQYRMRRKSSALVPKRAV